MENLINRFYENLSQDSVDVVMDKFFKFPERKDFIKAIHSKLESMILQGNATNNAVDMYNLLDSAIKNPNIIYSDMNVNSAELLNLLRTEQLDYEFTSVEYIDGQLKYCIKQQPGNYMFDDSFIFDCYTDFTMIINLLSSIIKNNPKADYASKLRARLALLRKLNGLVGSMKTPTAKVVVNRVRSKPTVESTVDGNCTVYSVS